MLPLNKMLFRHITRVSEPQDNSHGIQVGHKKGVKQAEVNWDGVKQEEYVRRKGMLSKEQNYKGEGSSVALFFLFKQMCCSPSREKSMVTYQ